MFELCDNYRGFDLGVAQMTDGKWSGLAKGIATVIRIDGHASKADVMDVLYRRINTLFGA